MALIDHAILRQLLLIGLISGLVMILLMLIVKAGALLVLAASTGVSWNTVGSLLVYNIPDLAAQLMPLLTFGTVLWIYARAVDDREVVVLLAAGVSPLRLARPALIFAALTTAVAWTMTLWLIPLSFGAFKDREHEVRAGLASAILQEGTFNPIGRKLVLFYREGQLGGVMQDVLFFDARNKDRLQTIIAERAWMDRSAEELKFLFESGSIQQRPNDGSKPDLVQFERFSLSADAESLGFSKRGGRGINERPIGELLFAQPSAEEAHLLPVLRAHGHNQLVKPLLCVMMSGLALLLVMAPAPGRRGAPWWRWPAALTLGAGSEWLLLAAVSAAERDLALLPGIWIAALLPGGLAWWLYLSGWRGRALRAPRLARGVLAAKRAST
ncbi:MAG TPA: LptF/LptG family permease [Kiloniellales bacterium]|nr:LptF/LptG family permease [Kiloniellales bacterium]